MQTGQYRRVISPGPSGRESVARKKEKNMATKKHGLVFVAPDRSLHLWDASTGTARPLTPAQVKKVTPLLKARQEHGKQLAKALGRGFFDAHIIDHMASRRPPAPAAPAPAAGAAARGSARKAGAPRRASKRGAP
jgi:hypothetical protein